MIVNLIKVEQMFSLTLPDKKKGQYWLSDIDENGKYREIISIEAIDNTWVVKSNKLVTVLDVNNNPIASSILVPSGFLSLKYYNSNERIIIYSETIDPTRQNFTKIVVRQADNLYIGRNKENNLFFANKFVSGKHAQLIFDGNNWFIKDLNSTNGTYVNGRRVTSENLVAGDMIYIMGLKIVIGHNYFAVNNPDGLLVLQSSNLAKYQAQTALEIEPLKEIPPEKHFFRSPRFYKEIEHCVIKIDPPPQMEKVESVPMALMLGPSLTMGMTSVGTALLSVINIINNGGQISQALPSIIMAFSMLAGTILWPILTKRYEKKQKIIAEKKRQAAYLKYLDEVRDEIRCKCKEQSDILAENLVAPDECISRIYYQKTNLWERAINHKDFLQMRLGLGDLPLDADVDCAAKKFTMEEDNLQNAMLALGNEPKILRQVPISISLRDEFISGVYGDNEEKDGIIKNMILQMMALHSYDELKIMIIDNNEDGKWNFIKFIPHFWDNEMQIRFLATTLDEVKELSVFIEKNIVSREDTENRDDNVPVPYYAVFVNDKNLAEKCEALDALLRFRNNRSFSLIYSAVEIKDLPKETKMVIFANGEKSCIFDREDTTGKTVGFVSDRVNPASLVYAAEKIANIHLELNESRYSLPNMITFMEMFGVGKIEHLNSLTRWRENNPTKTLQTPVGVDSYGGIFNLDLHEKFHGPHGLVAGMTGSGKSEFIITYILSLAVNYHPNEVAFILIDYKGGGLTGAFEDEERGIKLPHLSGTITNLDGAAVKRSLISIQSELRRRQAIFNEARKTSNEGTMDIYKYQQLYRDKVVSEPVPHLFIISDEFAELKTQQPEFMEQLISTARIGRSLGVHLILATQKPSGVVDDQIWSNSKFRVCLKVQEKADSQDMIKCPDAAELSQTGRFYLQVGYNEFFALGQSAWCGAEYVPTETVEKSVDNSIQIVDHLGRIMMNIKPSKKTVQGGSKVKQIVSIIKYLSDLANEEDIHIKPLWLPPIPEKIFVDRLEEKYEYVTEKGVLNPVIGEYDDPFNQTQQVLTMPFTREGNCLIYGSTGNGKTTLLTTICYSLLKNHTAEELNLYILDYGSETLKVFEKAPQVGGVMVSSDFERTVNFFKMLHREIDSRRNLFSEYGGDYMSYCQNSGKIIPNIVVLINNYAGFSEQYEDLLESIALLTRDGVKYGIYFAVTASNTNSVRYVVAQNFKRTLTMQLNDESDYSVVVGKTDGLIPSKFKGRGLINLGCCYEFQTACCTENADSYEFLSAFCTALRSSAAVFARKIPVLPEVVKKEDVAEIIMDTKNVPVGISKKSLSPVCINLFNKVAYPVASQEIYQTASFTEEWLKVLKEFAFVSLVDAEQILSDDAYSEVNYVESQYDKFVQSVFAEMVERNNTYKDANMDSTVLAEFEKKIIVISGYKKFFAQLSADSKEKMNVLLEKAEAVYKIHFIIIESISEYAAFNYEAWFKRHISGADGLWIGDGVADQYMLKISKVTNDLYDEIGDKYGFAINKNRPVLLKLLSSAEKEDE